MDRARWTRLREVFLAVRDLPPSEQEAALVAACAGDQAMLEDVRRLLGTGEKTEAFLEGIVADAASTLIEPSLAGALVGPYRIIRPIGQGGMGAVYLAERADGQFEQQVALKLIKPGLNTQAFLARFRVERQILAGLQHPNIARLLDGGIDDDGRPYFALEFVVGQPIDEYCDANGLTVDERLSLFMDVCRAVAHAHASLVVHRDLKPAHILVDANRQVRLLDFGIAKVIGDEGNEPGLTQLGVRAMTPEYASPEQVRGEAVGTSTDVYSLGVILYGLLTGARPYEFDTRSPVEIERVVCQTAPERPSTRIRAIWESSAQTAARFGQAPGADVSRSRRRLRGDLDVICLKALQKEPERRYSSVEAFQEDLRRNLAGLPVLARPDSLGYRASKFVARHRVSLGAAALVVAGFLTVAAYYTVRLADERDRAQLEADKAAQVADFLQGLFAVSDPSESLGETITARELLDEGAARIERDLAGQPAVRATMMRLIGDVYRTLGLFTSARPLLERALEDQRALYGDDHVDVAETQTTLAVLLQDLGDVEAAEPLLRSGLATRERLLGDRDPRVAESLSLLAFLLETQGDAAGAEAMARRVLAVTRATFPPDHPRVAEATAELGGMLRRQGRLDEAEPLLREALLAHRRASGEDDLQVASTARNLASLLRDRGELDEAEALYEEAIAIRRAILGEVHPEVAVALNSYALLLDRKGDFAGAVTVYREFLRILEQIHEGRPHADRAAVYNNMASAFRSQGELDEAEAAFLESIDIVDQVVAEDHPNRAFARIGLAGVYSDQGRFAAAEPLLRDALAIRRAGLPAGHRYIGDALIELGTVLMDQQRYDEAEGHLREAYAIYLEDLGEDDSRTERAVRRLDALAAARGGGVPLAG